MTEALPVHQLRNPPVQLEVHVALSLNSVTPYYVFTTNMAVITPIVNHSIAKGTSRAAASGVVQFTK